jgi:hypothetical protein
MRTSVKHAFKVKGEDVLMRNALPFTEGMKSGFEIQFSSVSK